MKPKKEPKLWVTVLKLAIGAAILIGGMGMILKYAEKLQDDQPANKSPALDWGILGDSPLRR